MQLPTFSVTYDRLIGVHGKYLLGKQFTVKCWFDWVPPQAQDARQIQDNWRHWRVRCQYRIFVVPRAVFVLELIFLNGIQQ